MCRKLKSFQEAEDHIESARIFVSECLLASPQRRYAKEFSLAGIQENLAIKESLSDSLEAFEADLMRWNWRVSIGEELFSKMLLAPNLQAAYFYRLSHALFLRGVISCS